MKTPSTMPGEPALAARLRDAVEGDVLFDAFSRGRYSTDASIYQIEPLGVVIPRTQEDVERAIGVAVEAGVPVLPRGAGTSQVGQTVGSALVVDCSRYLDRIVSFDEANGRVTVEPGIVLDTLNKFLKPRGLFYPVDVSTSAQATIGGMTGNNSCGSRSLRYGNMVHNVHAIDALLADGTQARFGPLDSTAPLPSGPQRYLDLVRRMCALSEREADEIARRFPKVLRRVGGYNIDMLPPLGTNLAHLLVGSEGTLAFFRQIELDLKPIPRHRALGVCHFPTFYQAMDCTQHIVKLGPAAVELVDRTMIELSRDIPLFRRTVSEFVRGEPDALLLTEFAGDDRDEQLAKLRQLSELMGDLGFPGAVVEATDPAFQAAIWDVRKAGLNIMMSMKGDGKPVSFIEDCAVRLEDLAEYTDRLTRVFHKYGTTGTWYAHASVGCLHVRPILNMKTEEGARNMRAIAEEAFAMVREYEGSHSGEHGDGLSRSEFHEAMFGPRIVRALEEVKDSFDPTRTMNPGKIVRPPRMDDRSLFRFKPGYRTVPLQTAFDWSDTGGLAGAVEMCNNNGACRKFDSGVMCPSWRATREEKHLTRGRANTLRLALSGQLGPTAFASEEMHETLDLCLSCKGCKRECPTGVDMARMKLEFLHHYRENHPLGLHDRLVAWLPHRAATMARHGWAIALRNTLPAVARLVEKTTGFSARRPLPRARRDRFVAPAPRGGGPEVALFVDTFSTWFEPENAYAAFNVLSAAGYRVVCPSDVDGPRPLCCGRTFLSVGLTAQARVEALRTLTSLAPFVARGVPVVGLEPSCLFTLRDEIPRLLPGGDSTALAACALTFEEFLARESAAGSLRLALKPLAAPRALLHGHCHQKAYGTMDAVTRTLSLVPELAVDTAAVGCCGMAGAFGYRADRYDLSMKIGEAGILPLARAAATDTLVVASGTSCRQQIRDGAAREALHVARVLEAALA
jgi:FAD/FMN-containing dehydrogenase/Fe-S oxidoreductase